MTASPLSGSTSMAGLRLRRKSSDRMTLLTHMVEAGRTRRDLLDDAEAETHGDGFGSGRHIESVEDAPQIGLDGRLRDLQFRSDLFVLVSVCDKLKHLTLTRTEPPGRPHPSGHARNERFHQLARQIRPALGRDPPRRKQPVSYTHLTLPHIFRVVIG